jgi:prepilin-type N-terminal cleavage/methylation domain-containing protein
MKKGFTLVELLIATALIIMFSSLTLPVGFNFFQESTLKDQTRNLESSLRKAQAVAIACQSDVNAGVKITEKDHVIFEGNSYENRRLLMDTVVPFSVSIEPSGDDEIIFEKKTGRLLHPANEALISLTFGSYIKEISINSHGKIDIIDL